MLGSVHDPITRKQAGFGGKRTWKQKPGWWKPIAAYCLLKEISELDYFLQNKLLKVMEDKRVYFDSYYDPDDENTPKYIRSYSMKERLPISFDWRYHQASV